MKNLAFALIILVSVSGCSRKPHLVYSSENFTMTELADGVYACIHRIGGKAISNAGVIDNGVETIIFDSFLSPGVAEELLTVIKGLGLSPVRYVVNSHAHNDHIRGNQVFTEETRIISTSLTAELIGEWEPLQIAYEKENAPSRYSYYDSLLLAFEGDTASREYRDIMMWHPYYAVLVESYEKVRTRLPDTFVDDEMSLNGPDRQVLLITRGKGHSESDLVLYLPDDRIVFSGDLLFNDCHPYLADGSLPGLKAWLDYLVSLDAKTVVPGHGNFGPSQIIDEMKDYILSIERLAKEMQEKGLSEEDAGDILIPEQFRDYDFDRFFPMNLAFALSFRADSIR